MGFFSSIFRTAKQQIAPDGTGDPVSNVAKEIGGTIRAFGNKEQGTKRQALDMLSDSKLSKAARPLTIIWILTLFTGSLVASWFGLETPDQYQELIFWSLLAVIGFYFPGRDLVKTFAKNNKRNRK